jgi:methionine synthase II (cobalamin-independent)
MVQSSVLGFPRMGANRELKKANEAYWADKLSRDDLLKEAKRLRLEHWKIQKDAGVDVIPSNDFAFYDHLLDHIQLFNVSTPTKTNNQNKASNKCRPFPNATLSMAWTPSTSTSPWAVATRRTASMSPVW